MLNRIWQLLPVFLYKRLARWHCEAVVIGGVRYVTAAPDVLIRIGRYPPP
jgi:hypothetical protein